jgi:peptidylprolyl isomerase
VARSRARERELARRRYERRRLREQQLRARRRRRNTIGGAVIGAAVVIVGLVWLGLALAGGSGKKAVASPAATPPATQSPQSTAAPTSCAPISPNPPAAGEPTVPPVTGKAPTTLVVRDIKKGTGALVKNGQTLTMNYVGVSCSTGKAFDASYPRKQPFTFKIGAGQVIKGWDQGILGMRVGGRRELVIPASLGYGPTGSGSIKPNETLIFVVDLVAAK